MLPFIREEIERLEREGLKRGLDKVVEGPQGPRVRINGREVILLCSNDYLGLSNDPSVREAAVKAIGRYGAGAGASRLISGNMRPHMELEEKIASFKGADAAILFNSGYHANLGIITALADRTSEIFSDRLCHASIVDACVLSRARVSRFRNNDVDSLERLLKRSCSKRKLIVTEGVFSMDGSVAPLKEMVPLLDRYGALLLLDDAHGTGALGESGRGTLELLNITHPSIIQMGTLGKAVGSFGAYAAGERHVIGLLATKARPFIYSTALPPAVAASAKRAIEIIEERPSLVRRLRENSSYMREGLKREGLDTLKSETQIIPVVIGGAKETMEASRGLFEKGVYLQGIRPPTVPAGTSRLRITVTSAHTREDLDFALDALKNAVLKFSGKGVRSPG